MPEKLMKLGLVAEEGWTYFLDDDYDVSRVREGDANEESLQKVIKTRIRPARGYVYMLDDDGDVSRMTDDEWQQFDAAQTEKRRAEIDQLVRSGGSSAPQYRPGENAYWLVKGKPSWNNLRETLAPGKVGVWVTKKPPKAWRPGDRIIFWEASPTLQPVGIGLLFDPEGAIDLDGRHHFWLIYHSKFVEGAPGIAELRKVPVLDGASFLKSAVAGTVFPLKTEQGEWLARTLAELDPTIKKTWPDLFGATATEPALPSPDVEVPQSGQGYGDAEHNAQVEQAAVDHVTRNYQALGWKVKSVEADKCGYDLHCTKDGAEEHVEVKGVSGPDKAVIVSANEYAYLTSHDQARLCIVTDALDPDKRTAHTFHGRALTDQFDVTPMQYRLQARER